MDPRHCGDILRHLEKQNELLRNASNSMSHELHKLQVEEHMLRTKLAEIVPQAKSTKIQGDSITGPRHGRNVGSKALITTPKSSAP